MTAEQIQEFRKEFKSIVYKTTEIKDSNRRLKDLHVWDKNGSHQNAILKELEVKKRLQNELKEMLKGQEYENWKEASKKLTRLTARLKTATANKIECETQISNLNFQL